MAPIVSKDDRIDLTQFEGTTEGPWNMDELGEIWRAVPLDAEPYCVMSFYHHPSIKPSEADLRLMAAGPALVAELKRCYAMLDAIAYEVAPCSECGGHREEEGLFHDCQNYCRCEDFDASE